jgi:Mrp family chromosome partitioning ATPase
MEIQTESAADTERKPYHRLHGDAARLAVRLQSVLSATTTEVLLVGGVGKHHGAAEVATRLSLALVSLNSDRRVLLLDANLKAPTVDDFFQIGATKGVAHAATAERGCLDALDVTTVPKLSILPAIASDIDHIRDILSAVGSPLLSRLRDHFDIIVISGPEDTTSFEFTVWATHAEHVLLTTAEGVHKSEIVERQKTISEVGSNLVGVLITHND